MNSHILNKYGFKQISIKEEEDNTVQLKDNSIHVSVVHPQDHKNPQIVFKLNRKILTAMNWEITDRVALMANKSDKTVALMKARKKDKNTFAISTQGTSVLLAKQHKRGGIVKIGWREDLCETITTKGTFSSSIEIFGETLIIKLPDNIFV